MLVDFLLEILLMPIVCVIATPVLLILSFFGSGSYWENMKSYYKRIKNFF